MDNIREIPLAEAQSIIESIVGPVRWDGIRGTLPCPWEAGHSVKDGRPASVLAQKDGTVPPMISCWHSSCKAQRDAINKVIWSSLGKRRMADAGTAVALSRPAESKPKPKPKYEPESLAALAAKHPDISIAWVTSRSPFTVHNRTPASFLHALFLPGDVVSVQDIYHAKASDLTLWKHDGAPYDARALDRFRVGAPEGVWFMCQPIDGIQRETSTKALSYRSTANVTRWEYAVLESDCTDPLRWLAAIVQLPLPIAAIYSSGGKSVHCLLKISAPSQADWRERIRKMTPGLVTLGADGPVLNTGVRLTRLPLCQRLGKRNKDGVYMPFETAAMQELYYLNPAGDPLPIEKRPLRPGGYAVAMPADQDGCVL